MLKIFFIVILIVTVFTLEAVHPEAKLSFIDYCNYFKYPVQKH
jgi:hypothetical protein